MVLMKLKNRVFSKVVGPIVQYVSIVLVAVIVTSFVMLISGYNIVEVFSAFGRGIFGDLYTISTVIRWSIPLIIGGVAVSIAFRAKLWNIGIEGQYFLGAVVTAYLGYSIINVTPILHLLITLLMAALVGGIWAGISGLLKSYFDADELITTFMLSHVAVLITTYLVLGPLRHPGPQGTTVRTPFIAEAINLKRFVPQYPINTSVIIAIMVAIMAYYLIQHTSFGYEVRMLGYSPNFARLGGISVNQKRVITLFLSGAIAALAGGVEVLAVRRAFVTNFMPHIGFDSIVVALFANNNPIGVIFSGLFFGALKTGAIALERTTDVPRAMVEVFQSVIILAIITKSVFKGLPNLLSKLFNRNKTL